MTEMLNNEKEEDFLMMESISIVEMIKHILNHLTGRLLQTAHIRENSCIQFSPLWANNHMMTSGADKANILINDTLGQMLSKLQEAQKIKSMSANPFKGNIEGFMNVAVHEKQKNFLWVR